MQLQIYTNPTWNSEIQFYTSVVQPVCVLCICLQFHKCTFSAKPFEEVNTSFQFEPEPQSTVTMHLVSDEKLSGDLNDSMLLWHLWRLCVVLKMHISLLFMVEHNPPPPTPRRPKVMKSTAETTSWPLHRKLPVRGCL